MTAPIRFFNRYSGEVEEEEVYGENFLRWAYDTAPGRAAVDLAVKRRLFSLWYGRRMNHPGSRRRIAPFVDRYRVEAAEFADPADSFGTFNEFFYRKLRPDARPVAADESAAVFPADGRHFGIQDLSACSGVFVKGQRFSLPELVGDDELAGRFAGGSLVLSRLCPVDYHRFHFPVSGEASAPRALGRALFSVSPIALRRSLRYLWENRRQLTEIDTDRFGNVVMLEIGATCVGSIVQTAPLPGPVVKGKEKGYFAFGGSAVVTLFERGRIALADDLRAWGERNMEVYARVGDTLGQTP